MSHPGRVAGHTRPAAWRRAWLWAPVAAYMAGIFWASSVTSPPAPAGVSDKWLHAAAYCGLALLALRALAGGRWSGVGPATLAAAWLVATAYGISDEVHQAFTPGRHPEWSDVVADALGALGATVVAGAWGIIRRL